MTAPVTDHAAPRGNPSLLEMLLDPIEGGIDSGPVHT
jgi:hypothetical protein